MWEIWPFTNLFREASSCTTKLQRCQLKSGDFFFRLAPPPPTEFANAAPPENFRFGPLQAILRGKRGSICQGLQLVEYSSNQTLAHIMEGDRGVEAREKRGAPNEQKKWTRKWTRMLSFGTVWKLHSGVWSSWLTWTLERYYEGWESGGKGAQKYGRRENVVREAEDSGPPLSPPTPPLPLSRSNKEENCARFGGRFTDVQDTMT